METAFVTVGNAGPGVRSDCEITMRLTEGGGVSIFLVSKVKVLYGDSILALCRSILDFFGLKDAELTIKDSGALPFVIAARLEAAVKQLTETTIDYLPDFPDENRHVTIRDRFRFTRLYIPGNTPSMMINAGLHSADGIILDLEDSVAPEKKGEARILVRNALRQINFFGAERMVRINQGEKGLEDLEYVVPQMVNVILIPKCEDPESVKKVSSRIKEIKVRQNLDQPVYLMPIVESALGVERSFEIAGASEDIVAIAIGLEDYASDLGVQRTDGGAESLYARTRLIVAAKAARIQAIDSVFSDVGDMEGLLNNVRMSKALGFEGMGCIHPRQIPVIHKGFEPTPGEIEKSLRIVAAYEEARKKGQGVVTLGTKMIDPPVVAGALKIIKLAEKLGLMPDTGVSVAQD